MCDYGLVWVDIAMNKEGLKKKDPRRWRCFIEEKEYWIRDAHIEGTADEHNFKTCSVPEPNERGLYGWLHIYGHVRIKNDSLYILLHPSQSPTQR